jgi:TonB-linked SusC/RagA family outer membrane protein
LFARTFQIKSFKCGTENLALVNLPVKKSFFFNKWKSQSKPKYLMKKCLLKLLVLLLASAPAVAQTVTGRVTSSADGAPLPGVSVLVKGTTSGTSTDTDGKYTLNVADPANSILVFSFIGFASQEIQAGNRTTIDATLTEDITQLGEVVVTALGIAREKKALGYSVQEVSGNSFTQARESNIINNLQGRVAGVQIYKGGTGPGGSSRIVIRGSNSLRGADAPLFVVDGVPFDNYNTATNQSEYGSNDQGQGIAQINPDDIESMTVLKGPEAGALYGNRGANGVILITTKRGSSRKGIGVNINSNLTFENPLILPKMQNSYGQGSNGVYNANAESSWGPDLSKDTTVVDWTGESRRLSADPDDFKKFLQTGKTFTNSIDLSGGDDKNTFRIGYTNYDNKGLLPNTSIKRNMATVRATSKLTSKLTADVKLSYSRQDGKNRPQNSGSPSNIVGGYMGMPRSVHFEDMKPWKDKDGAMVLWKPSAYSTLRNPYWVLYEDFNTDMTERYLTMVKLDYQITNWLKVFVRHGMDQRHALSEGANAYGIRNLGDGSLNFNSGYSTNRGRTNETNADFLITATKTFSDFTGSLSFGGNRRNSNSDILAANTNTLLFGGLYNAAVGSNPRPADWSGKTAFRVNSLYSFLNLSYKNFAFLDVTFRNDWSSSVAKKNRSFRYPAFSGSLIVSDMIQLPTFISYAKIRGGYAQTGNTIDPYSLVQTYNVGPGFNNAITASQSPSSITGTPVLFDPNVVAETVNSFEVGTDLKFFNNRIGIEAAYYNRSTTNQIIPIKTSGATGYPFKIINAGNVTNKGFEFVFTASPVRTSSGLNWDLTVNYNHNVNKVEKLVEGTTRLLLQNDVSSRAVRIVADEGKPMGDIYGRDFERDSLTGNVLIDRATGIPIKSSNKNTFLGNYQPKFTMGIVNTFSYKGVTLSFLIDMRVGGKFYSQSLAYMYGNGNAEGTLANREGGLIVDGVYSDDRTPNTTAIKAQDYWTAVGGAEPVASLFIYDATNIRLRELTLTYSLPSEIVSKTPFSKVSVGFVGRNLWLIKSYIPGIDPESSFNTTNAQGWENAAYPSYRSLGFNVNVGF